MDNNKNNNMINKEEDRLFNNISVYSNIKNIHIRKKNK